MSNNPFIDYYQNQAISGQTGGGFYSDQTGLGFKSFFTGMMPFLKKAGKTLFDTGVGIGTDIWEGKPIIDTLKSRGISAAEALGEEACDELRARKARKTQEGTGRRKKRCQSTACIKRRARSASKSVLQQLLAVKDQKLKKKPGRRI
jgi:hypothetical protein